MEHHKFGHQTLKSIVFVSSLLSVNVLASEPEEQVGKPQSKTVIELEKTAAEEKQKLTPESKPSDKTANEYESEYSKEFERARHFHQVTFNKDLSKYLLVTKTNSSDVDADDEGNEKLIEVKEDDIFYIKHGYEERKQKSHKKHRRYFSFDFDDHDHAEEDEDCWSFGKGSCNARDGIHYAFSIVSSSGDDFYSDSGESTDINTYASYRIQLASFFIESPGMATRRIHGLYAGRAWGFNFFNTDQWRLDLYKQRDTSGIRDLEGIQVRNKHTRAGVRLTGFFESSLLQMSVSPYSTAEQKDDGVAASLSYSHFWQLKNWNFYGSAGVQYQPKEVVNFYEADPTSFDNRKDRLNHDVELGFEYPLSRNFVIGGFAAYSQSNQSVPGAEMFGVINVDEKYRGLRSGILLSLVL